MLVRIKGASSGIVEYLEKGIKSGRGFTRDELDKRITLAGDISTLDNILSEHQDDNAKNNYLHITLSFFEDDVEENILQSVCDEAKDFFLAGDKNDSFYFYAEAHIPKIREYFDKDGKLIKRKPHIHLVIPHANLTTGKREELLSYVNKSHTKAHIDNFQEYINKKYNLESPKDAEHIRTKPISREDIIDRYRPTPREKAIEVKSKIYHYVMANPDIDSVEKLAERIEKELSITTKIRQPNNPNRPSYVHIDYKGGKGRGINLNHPVFHNDFLKNRTLETAKDFEAKNSIPIEQRIEKLQQWKDWDSLTARFVDTPLLRKSFWEWDKEEQEKFIAKCLDREQKQLAPKVAAVRNVQASVSALNSIQGLNTIGTIKDLEGLNGKSTTRTLSEKSTDDLHELHARNHAGDRGQRNAERGATSHANTNFLPPASQLHVGRKSPNQAVQLFSNENFRDGRGRTQFTNERDDLKAQKEAVDWKKIIDETDINRLLDYCAHYYGVDRSKYFATKNKHGANRVQTQKHLYSASDFLRAELNFNWTQTQIVLQDVARNDVSYPRTFTHENKEAWKAYYKKYGGKNTAWMAYKSEKQRIYTSTRFVYNKKLSYKQNQAKKAELANRRKSELALINARYQDEKYNAIVAKFHAFKAMEERKKSRELARQERMNAQENPFALERIRTQKERKKT